MANESLGQLTAQLGADLTEMRRSMDRAEKLVKDYARSTDQQLDRAESRWRRYGRKTSGAIGSLKNKIFSLQGAMVSLGAGFAVAASLRSFASLDQGLIEVQKTANLTDKQVGALRKEIEDLSLEVPIATEGLLEIAGAAGQLGVKGVKNISNFTETLGKMQIASDVVGSEGAKSLARLLNTAGEGTEKVDELGSVIVALGNNMAASEKEIIKMANEIGRGTAAFEVSSDKAAAYGAALKAMGARAELSGSAIARSMIEIEKAITKGGERFQFLRRITQMTGEEIRETFQEDSIEVFNAFIRGLNRMSREGASSIALLEQFGLKGVESAKGLTPLIKNVDQLEQALKIANEEVKNATALDKEAIRATESFSSQMRLAWNAVDQIAASIGEGLAPAIVDIVGDFREWVKTNDELINQKLPKEIDDIASGVGDLVTSMGKMKGMYDALPEGVVGAVGVGLVGRMLGGGKFGIIAGTVYLLNEQLKKLDLNLGQIIESSKDFGEIWDATMRGEKWDPDKSPTKQLSKDLKELQDFDLQAGLAGLSEYGMSTNKELEKIENNLKDIEELPTIKLPKFGTPAEQPDLAVGEAFLEVRNSLEEQYKQLKMNRKEWEKYKVVQEANIDPTSKLADEIRKQVEELQDMRELQQQAEEWSKQSRMAPAGIGPGYSEKELEESRKRMEELSDEGKNTAVELKDAFTGWANSYVSNLNDMLWESQLTFDKILQSFGKMITEMLIQSAMTDLMKGLFGSKGGNVGGGWFSGGGGGGGEEGWLQFAANAVMNYFATGAQGLAFQGGHLQKLAQGGLIDQPTFFKMANGGLAVGGEAGTEAVMPLTRTSGGDLGVKTEGQTQKVQYNTFNVVVQAPEGNISKESQRQLKRRLTQSVRATEEGA